MVNPTEYLDNQLTEMKEILGINGFILKLIKEGKVVYHKAVGYSDVERGDKIHFRHLFPICSITKSFTGVIIMQLCQEGKLTLDDPVIKYLPEAELSAGITIRHIASHSSQGVPGQAFVYCSRRYRLLSQIVEVVCNRAWISELKERIIEPLNLEDTVLGEEDPLFQERKTGFISHYNSFPGKKNQKIEYSYGKVSSSTGIISSIDDLVKFSQAIYDFTLVNSFWTDLMLEPTVNRIGIRLPYGIGWFVNEFQGYKVVGHYGQDDGISCLLVLILDLNITFVIAGNGDQLSNPYRLLDGNLIRSKAVLILFQFLFHKRAIDYSEMTNIDNQLVDIRKLLKCNYMISNGIELCYFRKISRSWSLLKMLHEYDVKDVGFDLPLFWSFSQIMNVLQLNQQEIEWLEEGAIFLYSIHPENPELLYYIGDFYRYKKDRSKAIGFYEMARRLPNQVNDWYLLFTYFELGRLYYSSNPRKSEIFFTKVVDLGRNIDGIEVKSKRYLKKLSFKRKFGLLPDLFL